MENVLYKLIMRSGFDRCIADAFRAVDRMDFVLNEYKDMAYEDMPLPIGFGQTISQPTTIAIMLSLLGLEEERESGMKILEVGCGSGYVIALIRNITKKSEIYGTERIFELYKLAKHRNRDEKVRIIYTPEILGLPFVAPFDRILVSASASEFPHALLDQLADNGTIVCPVRNDIVRIKKAGNALEETVHPGFVFVPLVY